MIIMRLAVSRGEAGQAKALLVLDERWQPVDAIPLDVGPRHFTLSCHTPALPDGLRSGDRKVDHLYQFKFRILLHGLKALMLTMQGAVAGAGGTGGGGHKSVRGLPSETRHEIRALIPKYIIAFYLWQPNCKSSNMLDSTALAQIT